MFCRFPASSNIKCEATAPSAELQHLHLFVFDFLMPISNNLYRSWRLRPMNIAIGVNGTNAIYIQIKWPSYVNQYACGLWQIQRNICVCHQSNRYFMTKFHFSMRCVETETVETNKRNKFVRKIELKRIFCVNLRLQYKYIASCAPMLTGLSCHCDGWGSWFASSCHLPALIVH